MFGLWDMVSDAVSYDVGFGDNDGFDFESFFFSMITEIVGKNLNQT